MKLQGGYLEVCPVEDVKTRDVSSALALDRQRGRSLPALPVVAPSGSVSPATCNKSASHFAQWNWSSTLLARHVPGANFNPAVTTTAKSHTAGLPGSRRGRRCVRAGVGAWTCSVGERASGGMDLPKRWGEERADNVVDDKHEKLF